ncbi:hypothetical protein FNV43_RR07619 [Rhamnella rubrinervis]|uniref:(+)-delta-cadinene synthase n=1 Tax=Rhamnella rubrinervis TaxID=2594499 RepID=A0A8K0HG39_9ROSA|nr:hypothetical protein FNV43_RR07619 [Rhamnella rubrinervis]
MELPHYSSIEAQVKSIKEAMFSSDINPYSFVSPSAYDTAWLAMVPDHSHHNTKPMFTNCLYWVLSNQKQQGFWGECDGHGMPTIECLVATLACIVALKKWNVGSPLIHKGLDYIHSNNAKKFLNEINKDRCPRWLAIVFPTMVELAQTVGLNVELEEAIMSNILYQRQRILDTEQLVGKYHYPPLLSFLEALPSSHYIVDEQHITKHLSGDGSLFQSPSATAFAFMATGNTDCLTYLQSLAQTFANGAVPTTYPMDEDLIKLSVLNHVQRLGLAEHFMLETEQVLEQVYENYKKQESWANPRNSIGVQLLKDSLAFRLLRMQGYNVLPRNISWPFVSCEEEIRDLIKNDHDYFFSVMLNIYRATDVMFYGEDYELEEARSFSRNLLEKSISLEEADEGLDHQTSFRKILIGHELSLPWTARLDHLEHRFWIEENYENNALWMGKAFFQRLSSHFNDKLIRLAKQNYEFRQSIYKHELQELSTWSKDWGLDNMGFGREKTTYCYFAIAASCSLPINSDVRIMAAKSAIIITVADDFFDMEGSLSDLQSLTHAIKRWDDKSLCGPARTIFHALDNIVQDMATKHLHRQGCDITYELRDLWYETFESWMTEAKWSRSESVPSMDEYLKVGMTSIATHTIVLPASCFLNPSLRPSNLRPANTMKPQNSS